MSKKKASQPSIDRRSELEDKISTQVSEVDTLAELMKQKCYLLSAAESVPTKLSLEHIKEGFALVCEVIQGKGQSIEKMTLELRDAPGGAR